MINLIPPERRQLIKLRKANTLLLRVIVAIVLLIGLIVIMSGIAYSLLHFSADRGQEKLALQNKEASETKKQIARNNKIAQKTNQINVLSNNTIYFSSLMPQLAQILPSGAVLDGVQIDLYDMQTPITITAKVTSKDVSAQLVENLNSSKLFNLVVLRSVSTSNQQTGSGTDRISRSYPYIVIVEVKLAKVGS